MMVYGSTQDQADHNELPSHTTRSNCSFTGTWEHFLFVDGTKELDKSLMAHTQSFTGVRLANRYFSNCVIFMCMYVIYF